MSYAHYQGGWLVPQIRVNEYKWSQMTLLMLIGKGGGSDGRSELSQDQYRGPGICIVCFYVLRVCLV